MIFLVLAAISLLSNLVSRLSMLLCFFFWYVICNLLIVVLLWLE
uniref:Uncharacterized protein n=1 Tax=Rhizophora mucronata TaxID=61149 RepID=A0A2P2NQG9_RHIMU